MTSWIQNHVLLELTRHATRRYTDLKPRDVEGNLFMYHLKGLISEGLIEKHETTYRLTAKGMRAVGYLSLETGKMRKQPKILTTVVCQNEAGEYLFVRWHRQPNIGLVSFPHGMMHYGESVVVMAGRELAEKAGLEADLTFMGDVYVRGMRENELDRHMLVHVFKGKNIRPGKQEELRPDVCEYFWASLESVKAQQYVPGFYEIAHIATGSDMPSMSEVEVTVSAPEV